MKKQVLFLLSFIVYTLMGITMQAQDDNRKGNNNNNYPDFEKWTEEQFRQWEDSVKNALYPPLEVITLKPPPDSLKQNENTGRSLFVLTNNTYVPNSVNVDFNKAVGEIPMTSAVSPAGGMTYNILIEVYTAVIMSNYRNTITGRVLIP